MKKTSARWLVAIYLGLRGEIHLNRMCKGTKLMMFLYMLVFIFAHVSF